MAPNDVVTQHGGACSGRARPKVELTGGSAALIRIMMAKLAELISADSIFVKTHLYPGE